MRCEQHRFYVYRLFNSSGVTEYIGKGSGKRLANQMWRHSLQGEIVKTFRSEAAAYAAEHKLIAEIKPPLNRCAGGGGSRARKVYRRKLAAEIGFEKLGPRRYVARELLKFDLSGVLDASKIDAIRRVANGPWL